MQNDLKVSLNGKSYSIVSKQDRPIGVVTGPALSATNVMQSSIIKKDVKPPAASVQLLKSESLSFKPVQIIQEPSSTNPPPPGTTYQVFTTTSTQNAPQGTVTQTLPPGTTILEALPAQPIQTIIKEIRPNYEPFEREIQRLKADVDFYHARTADAESRLSGVQGQLSLTQEQLRGKNIDNERLASELRRSQTALEQQISQIQLLTQKLSEKEFEFEQFKISYQAENKRIVEREIGTLTDRFLNERRNLEVDLQRLRQESDNAKLQAARSQTALQQLSGIESENKRLRHELADQREKYAQLEQALGHFRHLEAQNRGLRAEIEELQARNQELKNEAVLVRDLRAENRKLKDILDQRQADLEEYARQLDALQRQNDNSLRKSQKKTDSSSQKEAVRALEEQLHGQRQLNDEQFQEIQQLKADAQKLEKLYIDSQSEVNRLSALLKNHQLRDEGFFC